MDYFKLADELIQCKSEAERHRHKKSEPLMRGEISVIYYFMEVSESVSASAGEISEFCGVSTARMANMLNSLEKKGFIIRTVDPDDRRKILVSLTEQGNSFGNEKRQEMRRELAAMLQKLGEEDAAEYVRILKKIREMSFEGGTNQLQIKQERKESEE